MTGPRLPLPDPTEEREREREALRASLYTAAKRPAPAAWAEALGLAERTGVPAPIAARQPDTVRALDTRGAVDYDRLLDESPALARWLADPDNAALARDEVGPLERMVRAVRRVAAYTNTPGAGVATGAALFDLAPEPIQQGYHERQAGIGILASVFGRDVDAAADVIVANEQRAQRLAAGRSASAKAYDAAVERNADDPGHQALDALRAALPQQTGLALTVAEALEAIGLAARHPQGFGRRLVQQLPAAASTITGALLGGVAGTPGGPVGQAVGGALGAFAGGAPDEVAGELRADLLRRGVDLTDRDAVRRALTDPTLVGAIRQRALTRGLTVAAVNALLVPLSNLQAGAAVRAGASRGAVARAAAGDVAVQAVGEAAAEGAGDLAVGEKLDVGMLIQTALESLGAEVAMEGAAATRDAVTGRTRADVAADAAATGRQAAMARETVQQVQALVELAAAVAEAPTTASVPARLRALLETATGNGEGDEATAVYFQSADWDAYWQGQGRSPAEAAAQLLGDGGKAYDQARATGAPLAIPVGAYVAGVASEAAHFDGLAPIARTRPDGPSLAEAHAVLTALPETLGKLVAEVQATPADAAPASDPAAVRGAAIEQELLAAGRTPVEAKAGGALWTSFFRTVAAREGIDQQALIDRYPVAVRAGTMAPPPPLPALAPDVPAAPATGDVAAEAATAPVVDLSGETPVVRAPDAADPVEFTPPAVAAPAPVKVRKEFLKLDRDALLVKLEQEQARLDQETTRAGSGMWTRQQDDGTAVSGNSFSAGKARVQAGYTAKRVAEIEAQLRTLGVDDATIFNARMGSLADAGLADDAPPLDQQDPDFALFQPATYAGTDALNAAQAVARYRLPGGDDVLVQYSVDGDRLHVGFIGSTGGEGSLGMEAVRLIARDLKQRTGARRVTGERISGARPGRVAERELHQSAYHGSPHVFEKFSLHAIGTGEGNQSFGWGLYFAGRKEVAKWYKEALGGGGLGLNGVSFSVMYRQALADLNTMPRGTPEWDAQFARVAVYNAIQRSGDIDSVVRETKDTITRLEAQIAEAEVATGRGANFKKQYLSDYRRGRDERLREMEVLASIDRSAVGQVESGRLYKVEIPGDETMLHWDRPLAKQPAKVLKALREIAKESPMVRDAMQSFAQDGETGESLYRALRADEVKRLAGSTGAALAASPQKFASAGAEAASRKLASLGVTGIKYLDGSSRSAGDGSYNYVIFDDNLVQIVDYEQRAARGPRGRIRFGADGNTVIDLFQSANRSTFLHESGHFFYHVLDDLASAEGASDQLKADAATMRAWVGAEPGAVLTRDQQEQIARGFEAYLMEGKAPSLELRSVFRRFRAWLTRLYERAVNLGVEVTPEVSAVFDRLLATDAAIAEAEAATQAKPIFADPRALGVSEKDAARYERAVAEAHGDAVDRLTELAMRQLRREDTKEWRALWKAMEPQVRAEVEADPVYRALAILTGKTALPGVGPVQLDRAAAKAMLPAGATLPAKVATDEGGLPPDVVAEMLGFPTGRDLIVALAHAPKLADAVKLMTDERMREEHGERLTDAQLAAEARAAVLSTQQDAVLRAELAILATQQPGTFRGLAETVARPVAPAKALAAAAEQVVAGIAIRDLRPRSYEAAATRAAGEAARLFAKGDIAGAIGAKERQRMAAATYRAALEAQEAVAKARGGWRKLFQSDKRLAASHDMDLVNAARTVLASVGVGARPAGDFLKAVRAYDPDTAAAVEPLVEEAQAIIGDATSWKALTVGQFREVAERVEALRTLARRTQQMEVEGKLIDRQEAIDALTPVLEAHRRDGPLPGTTQAITDAEESTLELLDNLAAMRRMESWTSAMDGGQADGPFRRYLWTPVREAADRYRLAKTEAVRQYRALVTAIGPTLRKERLAAPELGYTFRGTAEVLGALLHRGNASNLEKLLVGRGWGTLAEDGTLDTSRWDAFERRMRQEGVLTKQHYEFVQAVWDLFEAFKPGAQRAHKQVYGYYFAEVTADAFSNEFGTYRGGYVPAKADPRIVPDARRQGETEALLGTDVGLRAMPSTGTGSTKSRVEGYHAALDINIERMVPAHLDWVTRFTHLQPAVMDAARLVRHRGLTAALDAANPAVRDGLLMPWLQRTALQLVETRSRERGWKFVDTAARYVRTSAAMQALALNIPNALQNLTGLSTAMVKVHPRHLGPAFLRYLQHPRRTAEAVREKSPFMRARTTEQAIGIQRATERILLDPSLREQASAWVAEHGYFLSHATQQVMDFATWGGAYAEAVAAGRSEAEAVRIADSAVRETQGSGAPEDIARVEAGTPLLRLFTMFSGYFNMKANLAATELVVAHRSMGGAARAGRMLYVGTFTYAVTAFVGGLILQAFRERPLDEDEDGVADDLAWLLFGGAASEVVSAIPLGGAAARYLAKLAGQQPYNAHLSISPALDALERAGKGLYLTASAPFVDREMSGRDWRDVLTFIGMATNTPAAALDRLADQTGNLLDPLTPD